MKLFKILKDRYTYRRTGLIPQNKDKRDYRLIGSNAEKKDVDLRESFNTPRNQGSTQACAAFATVSIMEHLAKKAVNNDYEQQFSPSYNWYYARKLHKWETENKGVWLRNALKALYSEGICTEELMPFSNNSYKEEPNTDAETIGEMSKMFLLTDRTAYFLLTQSQVKQTLSRGIPVVFGMWLNSSFYGNRTGVIKNTTKDNNAHAMVAVGYRNGNIITRNSWGDWWGDKGYCYIPEEYFFNNSFDYWCIDLMKRKED